MIWHVSFVGNPFLLPITSRHIPIVRGPDLARSVSTERMAPCAVSYKEHDAMRQMDQPEVHPNFDPMGPDPHMASQRQAGTPSGQFAVDPVCGKEIDPRTARFTATYLGGDQPQDTFFFCSDECKQLFERDPEQYIRLR